MSSLTGVEKTTIRGMDVLTGRFNTRLLEGCYNDSMNADLFLLESGNG
jgi:hypothetical protein